MTVTDANAATENDSPDAINTAPHAPNTTTATDASASTAEDETSARQLIDDQKYHVAKCDIINKVFDLEDAVERCVAYFHSLSQLTGCTRYTGYITAFCTCLQLLLINNNAMLVSA